MKKLLLAVLGLLGLAAQAEAAPLYGYVQITTTTALTPTLQRGSINVASGTIQNLNVTYGVKAATGSFSGAVTVGSLGAAGSQVLISSNAVLPGATFYNGGPINMSATENHSGTVNITGSLNGTGAVALGGAGNAVAISSNTILPGATFYQSGTDIRLSTVTLNGPLNANSNKVTNVASGSATTDGVNFNQIKDLNISTQTVVTASSATTVNAFIPTSLTAAITPSSSASRVKITASGNMSIAAASGINMSATIYRGTTNLATGSNTDFCRVRSAAGQITNLGCSITFIDSPATTAATAYTIRIKNDDGATTVTWGASDDQIMFLEEIR